MRGINPFGGAGSGVNGEMKGINPFGGAESGVNGGMRGINPLGGAVLGLKECLNMPDVGKMSK
ncbi:hypothetical protein [Paenibacillus sp. FSL R7-0179]|uniref:hypothetical protein n=1 Tax=Paenibacillus sp. FSL R7-0179 TaxID=2921672 RepID=UPI0030FA1487